MSGKETLKRLDSDPSAVGGRMVYVMVGYDILQEAEWRALLREPFTPELLPNLQPADNSQQGERWKQAYSRFIESLEAVCDLSRFLYEQLVHEYNQLLTSPGQWVTPSVDGLRRFWEWHYDNFMVCRKWCWPYARVPADIPQQLERHIRAYLARYTIRPLRENLPTVATYRVQTEHSERLHAIEQIWMWAWRFSRMEYEASRLIQSLFELVNLVWNYQHSAHREYFTLISRGSLHDDS